MNKIIVKKEEFKVEKNEIAKRLKNLSDALGYKLDSDFAKFLNLKKGSYSSIQTGVSALSFRTMIYVHITKQAERKNLALFDKFMK